MIALSLASAAEPAHADGPLIDKVRRYRQANQHKIISELVELLSIPNVSTDRANIRRNADQIVSMMKKRNIAARLLETRGNPLIFGRLSVPGAKRTLMFYAHYDGQPVDHAKWTDSRPFVPVLRPGKLEAGTRSPKPIPFLDADTSYPQDFRIYARGTSDDRAPIVVMLSALDALMHAEIPIKSNIKFIFEGEEEVGSPNLKAALGKHRHLLQTDVLYMCDGPSYYSGSPTLFFGARGIVTLSLTVYGPSESLHSGHYGNWAPNPAVRLAHLLASMRSVDGRVLIKGFYDSVVGLKTAEAKALAEVPGYEHQIKELYSFAGTESPGKSLLQAIQLPALNVNGIHSGWVGAQARTIIPPAAEAAIDIRLVKGNDPVDMLNKVITHIEAQGYRVIDKDPDRAARLSSPLLAKVVVAETGYRAARTAMDLRMSAMTIQALKTLGGRKPVLLPSLGGSLPNYIFEDVLGVDAVIGVPIANHDNNQHQPDENIRIGHLWTGMETMAAIMSMGMDP